MKHALVCAALACAACVGRATPAACAADSECGAASICFAGGCREGSRTDGGIGVCFSVHPSFTEINESYFQIGCGARSNTCHSAGAATGSVLYSTLDLESDPYAALVNVPSQNLIGTGDGGLLVAPGDPDRSFLVQKIKLQTFHSPAYGPGMPPDHPGTSCAENIDAVRQWIAQGAQRN